MSRSPFKRYINRYIKAQKGLSNHARVLLVLVGVVLIMLTRTPAFVVEGYAHVHDGDTLTIGQQAIRLWGIDAVELDQKCGHEACGHMSRDTLRRIIDSRALKCTQKDTSYNRIVAKCAVDGEDISAEMIRAGMAFEIKKYSKGAYSRLEAEASAKKRGLWGMRHVEPPAHWRMCNMPRYKNIKPHDCKSAHQ